MARIAIPRAVPGCLRERSFLLLFSGQATAIVGDAISMIALPFAILALGGSVTQVGLVLAARAIPNAIFLLAGGVWADRLPRRLVMLVTDLVRGLVLAAVCLVLLSGGGSLPILIALMAIYGAAEAFFRPALSGIIPQTVSPKHLQEAYGLFAMTPALGIAMGGALGGLLVAVIGPAGAIAANAATFGVSAICLFLMRVRPLEAAARGASFLADLGAGWREFSSRSWLVVVVIGEVLYALFVMPSIYAIGPVIADDRLGGSSAWAAIISGFGIGFLLGGLTAMRVRPHRPIVFSYVVSLPFAAYLIAIAVLTQLWLLVALAIAAGAVISISGTLLETTITREVAPEKRARVGSFRTLGSVAMLPVGMVLAGPLTDLLGAQGAVALGGAAVLLNVAMVLATPSVRRLTADYAAVDEAPSSVTTAEPVP